ncbi:hypothetical protein WMF20_29245 [Sorangium sp. So ce834]|uniref:hypothetical protein n=1 Tax=Sorangium sp. So ce834 TaxID=3133321 RepID=UPI003F61ABC7
MRVERTSGQAPGMLPALLRRHLLPIAVTLHVDDLGNDHPPAEESVEQIEMGAELGRRYQALQRTLLQQSSGTASPSSPGRCSGNWRSSRRTSTARPTTSAMPRAASTRCATPRRSAGAPLPSSRGAPAGELLPNETWLVDVLRRAFVEGRNVMVFCWHLELMPRLARLLEEATGQNTPILWANKVAPKKRGAWIDKEIVGSAGGCSW